MFQLKKNSSKILKSSGRHIMIDLSRGARPEDDFVNSEASSDEDDVPAKPKKPGSRPHSGTSITSGTSPQTVREGHKLFQISSKEHMPDVNKTVKASAPKAIDTSREYKPQFRGHQEAFASPLLNGPGNKSLSRLSRKSLREIPSTDARFTNVRLTEISIPINESVKASKYLSYSAHRLAEYCFWSACYMQVIAIDNG